MVIPYTGIQLVSHKEIQEREEGGGRRGQVIGDRGLVPATPWIEGGIEQYPLESSFFS